MIVKKGKVNLEFLLVKAEVKGIPEQVEQEMQENSWRFASAPHTSVSPVLHAKIL